MPFPEVKRVIYNKNPLDRVICQLRFPPILRIDTEIPSIFQERVRADYPNLSETSGVTVEPSSGMQKVPPEEVKQLVVQSLGIRNYAFSSEDEQWTINLTRNFLALSTTRYVRWEEFRARLRGALEAFVDVYSPVYFSRIGLRYIDVIVRSRLGLNNTSWNELIQPHLLGILALPDMGGNVQRFESAYDIRLHDGKSVVRVAARTVDKIDTQESCFMIDSDFFKTQKLNRNEVFDGLNYLNTRASRLIRWCITERLHQAMEPQLL